MLGRQLSEKPLVTRWSATASIQSPSALIRCHSVSRETVQPLMAAEPSVAGARLEIKMVLPRDRRSVTADQVSQAAVAMRLAIGRQQTGSTALA